jgi:hypothetical protein
MKGLSRIEIIINDEIFNIVFYIIKCSGLISIEFLNTIELYSIKGKVTIKKGLKKQTNSGRFIRSGKIDDFF